MHQETLSLKTTAKGARVWLNNKTLSGFGFVYGAKYKVEFFDNYVEVCLDEEGGRAVANGDIIDLQNTKKIAPILPFERKIAIKKTLNWLKLNK